MITVARCTTLQEAQFLKMMLESSGIDAFIPDEVTLGMAPFLNPKKGIRVEVGDSQEAEARAVIAECRENDPHNEVDDSP